MFQQEELLATNFRFINGVPCADMPLDCDMVGIAVDQRIVFLLLFLHKLSHGQLCTCEVQPFLAKFQPSLCAKVKFFSHQNRCRMVHHHSFLHQNRLPRIIVRPAQVKAVQSLRHIFIPQSAIAEKTRLIKDFDFLQCFVQKVLFLRIHIPFLEKIRQLCKADAVHIVGFDRTAIIEYHHIADRQRMTRKIFRTLDIEPFINAIQRVLFRKRRGIDQVIICTGNRYAFLLHIVQSHEAVVMFRVTGSDLINTVLLFAAIQQHIFLFCHVPLLLQICYCNLEGITSALNFLSRCDKNRPRADADEINLLSLVIQPQSLFTVYHCQRKIRAHILVLCIIFPLFQ